MDAPLIKRLALLFACVSFTAGAQALQDPTRPPTVRSGGMESENHPAQPVLQAIVIAPWQRSATINGQVLRVGDKFNNARVVRIVENEVTLRSGKQEQTLRLFRGIRKVKTAAMPAPTSAD